MANPRSIVALSVGSQQISMGVFSSSNGELVLENYATRQLVLDPTAEGMRLARTSEIIAELVNSLGVKGNVASYSVSGQSVFIRFIKLPALDDTDIEQLIRYEAQQNVPFPLDEVVWDYHLLPSNGLEREAVLVAIKADELDALNKEILSQGLQTGKVDCSITALYNAYIDSYPDETEPVMLVDIGAKSTDIIYSESGRFFTRSISAGGVFLTTSIARELGISFEEAERQKTTSGLVAMSNGMTDGMDPSLAGMANAIRTGMTRLASEIQRTTNHYRAQMKGSAPTKIYLCGGGAALPYTKEFLEEKLGLPVVYFNPMHNVAVGGGVDTGVISREAFMLGSLIGTGLNAIGREKLGIDLEPTDIAKDRYNKKKMPAIYAGMTVAVLGAAAFVGTNLIGLNEAEAVLAKTQPVAAGIKKAEADQRILKQEITVLDKKLANYQSLTLQRFGYADIVKHILEESVHKEYPYWFTQFEPLVYFNPKDRSKMTGESVVSDNFLGDKLTSIKDVPVPTRTSEDGEDVEAEESDKVYAVNAIRLTGYAQKSKQGDQLIQQLQAKIANNKDSLFTYIFNDAKLQERQVLETGTKDAKGETEAGAFSPFKLILPLKKPIPVRLNQPKSAN